MNLDFNRLLQGNATSRQRPKVGASACILPTSHRSPLQASHKKRQAVIEDEQGLRSIVSHHMDRVSKDAGTRQYKCKDSCGTGQPAGAPVAAPDS